MFPSFPKYDYEKLISVGMSFKYEIGQKTLLTKFPRWTYYDQHIGWVDEGKTGLTADAEVLAIQDNVAIFVLFQARSITGLSNQSQQYGIPLNNKNIIRGKVFNPFQWEWDGFIKPDGGWEIYVPVKEVKICSCGAEGYAKATRTPVSGHGAYCQKWEPNPYQR